MVSRLFGLWMFMEYVVAVDDNFYVAQAPFTTTWNDEHRIQHDNFASSGFDNQLGDNNGVGGNNNIIGTQPRFYPGQWGSCSTTCGPGVATRTVECIAIQGITSNIIKLPDYECEGKTKPNAFQPCQIQECALNDIANNDVPVRERSLISTNSFKWDYGDWTVCSASCLGGKQRSTLKCVDIKRRTAVAWSFCDAKQRPVDLIRSCNNDPCPPEWDVGEMSQCSHTCGGGLRTRKVRCIRRISRTGGAESTLILPDGQCPQPKPVNSEACGLVDCPVMWKIGNWGQCSTTCGPGEQRREVTCEQRVADGELKSFYPPIQCRHIEKPPTVQLCDLGTCNSMSDSIFQESDNDKFSSLMSTSMQQQHSGHSRKLTLNIGGSAKLFVGTSLKVKCPVRNYAKNKIIWTKDGKKITSNAHIKVSSNGALRIFHARMEDAGVYACIANGIQGNVTLSFKSRENKDENINDSRSMLNQNMIDNDIENDPVAVDQQLLQKVRQSLKDNEDIRMLERLAAVTEPGDIKIDYAAGEWSKCSNYDCGKSGRAQVRQLKCRISYQGSIGYLDDDVCESFGVVRPPSSRSCLPSYCPRWQTSPWSECSSSRCIRHSTSMQRRDVKCAYENGTNAAFELCDRESRPKVKKECINVNCTADWRPSVWGQCSRTCGDGGVQMRLLRCVWRGTRKPAGRNCQSSLRPIAIRACQEASNLPPCPPSTGASAIVAAAPNAIDIASKPFLLKGLENWRGWKLYDWSTDSNGNFRRKF
uniref:Ig-like domain-containing protein n=1 Tax=Loa loa TaxID=7209 RepID=A0A1I7VID5_LOALO